MQQVDEVCSHVQPMNQACARSPGCRKCRPACIFMHPLDMNMGTDAWARTPEHSMQAHTLVQEVEGRPGV